LVKNENIYIKDACIIIDLFDLEIFHIFLQIDAVIIVTQAVAREITDINQKALLEKHINSKDIVLRPDGDIHDIKALTDKYRGISYSDATALDAALKTNGTLLSADGLLRKACKNEGGDIYGSLWVICQLVELGFISVSEAVAKTNTLMVINPRTPKQLCKKIIKEFEAKTATYHTNK